MKILSVDMVIINLLNKCDKYHDNYILKTIFLIIVYIYRQNSLMVINYLRYHDKYIYIYISNKNK